MAARHQSSLFLRSAWARIGFALAVASGALVWLAPLAPELALWLLLVAAGVALLLQARSCDRELRVRQNLLVAFARGLRDGNFGAASRALEGLGATAPFSPLLDIWQEQSRNGRLSWTEAEGEREQRRMRSQAFEQGMAQLIVAPDCTLVDHNGAAAELLSAMVFPSKRGDLVFGGRLPDETLARLLSPHDGAAHLDGAGWSLLARSRRLHAGGWIVDLTEWSAARSTIEGVEDPSLLRLAAHSSLLPPWCFEALASGVESRMRAERVLEDAAAALEDLARRGKPRTCRSVGEGRWDSSVSKLNAGLVTAAQQRDALLGGGRNLEASLEQCRASITAEERRRRDGQVALEALSGGLRALGGAAAAGEQQARTLFEESERALISGRELDRAASALASVVHRLLDSLQRLSNHTSQLEGLTTQTDLLALNASVEVSRLAGQGEGFAAVAAEIRAVGGQAAQSSGNIISDLKEVQEVARESQLLLRGLTRQGSHVATGLGATHHQAERTLRCKETTLRALAHILELAPQVDAVHNGRLLAPDLERCMRLALEAWRELAVSESYEALSEDSAS